MCECDIDDCYVELCDDEIDVDGGDDVCECGWESGGWYGCIYVFIVGGDG